MEKNTNKEVDNNNTEQELENKIPENDEMEQETENKIPESSEQESENKTPEDSEKEQQVSEDNDMEQENIIPEEHSTAQKIVTQTQPKKSSKFVAIGCGLFVLGAALGVGGTLLVQKQPWKDIGSSSELKKDYDLDKCVTLGDYKGITVSLAVSDEDIQSEIDNLIEENTTYEQKKGTVKDGDKIYAKFDGYVNGKKMDDTCGEETIDIGSGDYIEGFDKGFIGAKTGKAFEFKVDVPKDTYGDDSIDGKTVTFKCTVEYICGNEIVPEWNDDFVQSVSEFKTTDEYKADLKKQLEEENESSKQDFAWTQVLDNSKVNEYPVELMKAAKEEVLQGYYDMADMYGMSRDEIFQSWGREDEADFVANDLEGLAQDSVKETLVTEAIAKAEGINYSDDEYQNTVSEEYEYNQDEYDSKEDYEKANRGYLKGLALNNKVQEWIAGKAKFTK